MLFGGKIVKTVLCCVVLALLLCVTNFRLLLLGFLHTDQICSSGSVLDLLLSAAARPTSAFAVIIFLGAAIVV